jgi:hypothetical protein
MGFETDAQCRRKQANAYPGFAGCAGSSVAAPAGRARAAARRTALADGGPRGDSAGIGWRGARCPQHTQLEEQDMFKARIIGVAIMAAGMAVASAPAQSKGCIKGAVVGGVGGHLAGHHAVAGAVVGCAIGHHIAAKREREAAQAAAAQAAAANASAASAPRR